MEPKEDPTKGLLGPMSVQEVVLGADNSKEGLHREVPSAMGARNLNRS